MRQKLSISRLKRGTNHIKKLPFYIKRLQQLKKDENIATAFNVISSNSNARLFNLDLHIGVIADLEIEITKKSMSLTRWSISSHNHLVSDRLPVTDPVRFVNARKWHLLNDSIIDKFQNKYGKFLKSFDGFVCTYSPVFAELYRGFNKPILIVAATRYEAPYTNRKNDWNRFNKYLVEGVDNSRIALYANNQGDADYLDYFTGLKTKVVPSYCEKSGITSIRNGPRVIISKDQKLTKQIEFLTDNFFRSVSILGTPYKWNDLTECTEVLVFPQNISTMTLFELATAGVPVAIPSRRWIKELIASDFKLLNELSFHQILGLSTTEMPSNSPANYNSDEYLDWWLNRADFFNQSLMPNVRVVDSVEDLIDNTLNFHTNLHTRTVSRNLEVVKKRGEMISHFMEML
jgi:hypothetical protein